MSLDNSLFDPAYRTHHRKPRRTPLQREDTQIRRKVRQTMEYVKKNSAGEPSNGPNQIDEHLIQAIVNTVRLELQEPSSET
jgi:hypothetical protein